MNLAINNLTKSFGEKQIFVDFSYSFSDEGLYIIKGDSGIGKTTLLRIISGIDKEYAGSVLGGGVHNVSFAFQEYRLFPQLNIIENLTEAVYKKATAYDVMNTINMLLKLGFSKSDFTLFPHEMSGGMKQRVSLARAFLRNAPILILDEPTKELDKDLCKVVNEMICQEAKKRLVIMVTHNENDLALSDATIIDLNQNN